MKWRRFLLVCSMMWCMDVGAQVSGGSPSDASFEYFESPAKSLLGTRQFIDGVALRVLAGMGYQPGTEMQDASRFLGQRGVLDTRVYVAQGQGPEKRIGLAILQGMSGGYDVALYTEPNASGSAPTVGEVAIIKQQMQLWALKVQQDVRTQSPEVGYEMIRLGNMEADRAVELLKAMGYATMKLGAAFANPGGQPTFVSGSENLPLIIDVGKASKTSLMDAPDPRSPGAIRSYSGGQHGGIGGAPELGGTYL
ncbi:MAG: hypothetical protein O3B73_08385, partial [bacterium]|nr:hypothetical protein [bacterium]